MTTKQKLEDAQNRLESVPGENLCYLGNARAARMVVERLKSQFLIYMVSDCTGGILNANQQGPMLQYIRSNTELSNSITLLDMLEGDPRFQAARDLIEPIEAEIAELQALLAAEERSYATKVLAIRDAEDAAIAKARVAVQSDPSIEKLRRDAEKARPAHVEPDIIPFRGQVAFASKADRESFDFAAEGRS